MSALHEIAGFAECGVDDEAFERLPGKLSELCEARSTLIQWRRRCDGDVNILAHSGYFSKDHLQRYAGEFSVHDPWATAAKLSAQENKPLSLAELVPASVYENSFFYNEFVRTIGDDTFHCIGMTVTNSWGSGMVAIQRGRSQEPFSRKDVSQLGRVAPQLGRSLAVRGSIVALGQRALALDALIAALHEPAALVGRGGALMLANRSFERMAEEGDMIQVRAGRVVATDARLAARMEVAIANSQGRWPVSDAFVVPKRSTSIILSPLADQPQAPLTLVLVKTAGRHTHRIKRVAARFGLTPAEADVASSLCEGKAVKQIAAERHVAVSTVRFQVRMLLEKLGCARQAQMVALIQAAAESKVAI